MKRQLNVFFLLTLIIVLFAIVFALWRIKEFDNRRLQLLTSSHQLQKELDSNFANTRAIGVIRTHLRIYMKSGEAQDMKLLHEDVEKLEKLLGDSNQKKLDSFSEMVKVLDVRMRSLRQNSQSTFEAEQDIMAITHRLLQAVGPDHFFLFQQLTSGTCLTHHRLYVNFIFSGQIDTIEAALQKEGTLFTEVDRKLLKYEQQFPGQIQKLISQLRNAYYELDEAVTTIAAIRIRILRTRSEVMEILNTLESEIAEKSLQQNGASRTLMADSLILARNNITVLYSGLILAAISFALIALLLNRRLISPLVHFVELLGSVTQMLAGLRTHEVVEDEHYRQLVHMADTQHNEIGDVAHSIENMVHRLRDLSLFRQAIEHDETTREIICRLGKVFSDKLGLESYAVYEIKGNRQEMELVCAQPESARKIVAATKERKQCRAWRTGAVISSIEAPSICECDLPPGQRESICIPMRSGTEVLGLVQFMPVVKTVLEDGDRLSSALVDARHYIAETLPVLQSRHLAHRLECMATEDPLTGLFNRRYLELSLDRISAVAQRRDSHIGILMCDVDYFKPINDELGHDAGDEFLQQLAGILSACVRESDLVVRFGGEEFLILLIDIKPGEAQVMGERIRDEVENHAFRVAGSVLRKTISIGALEFAGDKKRDIREGIKAADVALYRAKENGRNQVAFSAADDQDKE
ncbi:MAG: GGDEF domain-containing protein [Thermodesulfobacteriota bacterium]